MLSYPFKDYEGFKELFGVRNHGNGASSRRNTVLLAFFKSKAYKYVINRGYEPDCIQSMSKLKTICLRFLCSGKWSFDMNLNEWGWDSSLYRTDALNGKTEDGDAKAIRYVRKDTGKVYKMKAGKMYRHLILETYFGRMLPEQVIVWLCEELTQEWIVYNIKTDCKLVVNDDFKAIYDSQNYCGGFDSCMTSRNRHVFYNNAVKAKAASLWNKDGKMIARAVIFTDVTDIKTGKKYRLCERQYSSGCCNTEKQLLVNALISEGLIDGYKRIGADCHSPRSFEDVHGNSLSECNFEIDCDLDLEDVLSYQDSFKWYDIHERKAYNHNPGRETYDLATTEESLCGDLNYDEYHEEYTSNNTVSVYFDGQRMSCDENNLEDFENVGGVWYHRDELSYCSECEDYYRDSYGEWSDVTEEEYCCDTCRERAERRYCDEHPDEYVWFNGRAVPADEISVCPECGDVFRTDDGAFSVVTEQHYCSDYCRDQAATLYIEENPDCGYAYCSECGELLTEEHTHVASDGKKMCKWCFDHYGDNLATYIVSPEKESESLTQTA